MPKIEEASEKSADEVEQREAGMSEKRTRKNMNQKKTNKSKNLEERYEISACPFILQYIFHCYAHKGTLRENRDKFCTKLSEQTVVSACFTI